MAALRKAIEQPQKPASPENRSPAKVSSIMISKKLPPGTGGEGGNSPMSKLNPLKYFDSFESNAEQQPKEIRGALKFNGFSTAIQIREFNDDDTPDKNRLDEAKDTHRSNQPQKSQLKKKEVNNLNQKSHGALRSVPKLNLLGNQKEMLGRKLSAKGKPLKHNLESKNNISGAKKSSSRVKDKPFRIPYNSTNLEGMLGDLKKANIDPDAFVEDPTGLGFASVLNPVFFKNTIGQILDPAAKKADDVKTFRVNKQVDILPFPQIVTVVGSGNETAETNRTFLSLLRQQTISRNNLPSSSNILKQREDHSQTYSNHSLEVSPGVMKRQRNLYFFSSGERRKETHDDKSSCLYNIQKRSILSLQSFY